MNTSFDECSFLRAIMSHHRNTHLFVRNQEQGVIRRIQCILGIYITSGYISLWRKSCFTRDIYHSGFLNSNKTSAYISHMSPPQAGKNSKKDSPNDDFLKENYDFEVKNTRNFSPAASNVSRHII